MLAVEANWRKESRCALTLTILRLIIAYGEMFVSLGP